VKHFKVVAMLHASTWSSGVFPRAALRIIRANIFVKGQTSQVIFVKDQKGQVTHLIARQPDGQELKVKKTK
jgi:hypothetical protein